MNTSSDKKIILTTVAVAVVFFVGGFFANTLYQEYQQKSANTVAKNFITDLTAGNTAAAYKLTSQGLQTAQKSAEFDSGFSGLKTANPVYQTSTILRSKNAMIYQQRVSNMPKSSTGSTDADFSITLVSQNGSWKVDNALVQ